MSPRQWTSRLRGERVTEGTGIVQPDEGGEESHGKPTLMHCFPKVLLIKEDFF